MRAPGLTIMLVVPAAHTRLSLTRFLAQNYTLVPHQPDMAPMRTARTERPGLVLIAVRRRSPRTALELAQKLKTEGNRPPRVALIDTGGVLRAGDDLVQRGVIDGLLLGPIDAQVVPWVAAVCAGQAPIVGTAPSGGLRERMRRAIRLMSE
jgi:hypothetical protein